MGQAISFREHIASNTCGESCQLSSSAGNTVTMELATTNDEDPCGDMGFDAQGSVSR